MRLMRAPAEGGVTGDALATDQYLDGLLAQAERAADSAARRTADGAPAPDAEDLAGARAIDPAVRHGAAVLRATLLRAHPSFRFEERLAAQLADLAAGQSRGSVASAGPSTDVVPFPVATASPSTDPLLVAVLAGRLDPSDEAAVDRTRSVRSPARPLLVGGAITSAAISLVGVVWVAWRASRPSGARMGRAARAAHARRIADLAAGVPGGTG